VAINSPNSRLITLASLRRSLRVRVVYSFFPAWLADTAGDLLLSYGYDRLGAHQLKGVSNEQVRSCSPKGRA